MNLLEIRARVTEIVSSEVILPNDIVKILINDLYRSQKDKFVEIVTDEITKTVKDELSAHFDTLRNWK